MKNNVPDELSNFHGHLGPYVVLGYRMGKIANRELGEDPFEKEAVAKTGNETPISCIVDGIQYSSSCTMGKGNIEIEEGKKPLAIFSDGSKNLEIELKPEVHSKIKSIDDEDLEEISEEFFAKDEEELFDVQVFSSR